MTDKKKVNKGKPPIPPTKWKSVYYKQAYQLALLGHTDKEIAKVWGIAVSTLNKWKLEKPRLSESLTRGRDIADAEVAAKLHERAIGYSHPDTHFSTHEGEVIQTETVKHYPPSEGAAKIWLSNRQRGKWTKLEQERLKLDKEKLAFEREKAASGSGEGDFPTEINVKIIQPEKPNEEREDLSERDAEQGD